MEQLRQLAKTSFDSSEGSFKPNAAGALRLVQLALARDEAASGPIDNGALTETDLHQLLDNGDALAAGQPPEAIASASVRLVVVPRAEDDAFEMSHDSFGRLVDRFEMDHMVLQHIASNSYGFHAHKETHTFYVGTYVYSLAWSADPRTLRTNAVLLLRTSPVLRNGNQIRDSFLHTLCSFSPHLYAPHYLLFVIYVHLSTTSRVAVALNVENVRKVETQTRHGPGRGAGPRDDAGSSPMKVGIDELSGAAQDIAITQVHLANLLRHDPYIKDIAAYLQDLSRTRAGYPAALDGSFEPAKLPCLDEVPSELRDKCGSSLKMLSDMLRPLQKMTSDLEPTVRFLQTRADCQSSVISSLMTHEDARLNTELARLSTELGEAARRDSSAMRSIAMMTMIFLPSTFFAALFSMPCIPEWAQTKFWVYWVCAIPSTVIVFVTFRYYHRSVKKAKERRQLHQLSASTKIEGTPLSSTSTGFELNNLNGNRVSVVER